MIETQKKTKRIHSLDSLRAIMMLLGLVLHSAITYSEYTYKWPLKDSAVHISNDFIVSIIHAFRMQVFFLVAGFFGSMLFYERGLFKMIKNRVKRIILPFIVFIFSLSPILAFAFTYTKLVFEGDISTLTLSPSIIIPRHTLHLWFLYYLSLFTLLVTCLACFLRKMPHLSNKILSMFKWLINRSFLRIIIFSAITAIILILTRSHQVSPSTSFIPEPNTFIYYLIFYLVGWILYKSKEMLVSLIKNDWFFVVLAISLFSFYFFAGGWFNYIFHVIINAIIVWLFVFGITGLFIRYMSHFSSVMRYMSDASYWVYLIHLFFVAIIPSFISNWPIPSTLRFLFVLIISGALSFLSYHYLVRSTFIGKFLNGKKYNS
ncbi:MAG: 2,3,4,5-tetrahydropyridine-2,6-carboxylate N-succinyltransferase [Crocinitomicaceae bacterium]|nr:2,3,4,5-tetrahydropyridine-2,6-carboxylate N-succinyltransferase [Crocinitomicaceae bacterium]|tara:strand:- start:10138 stop:11262 length:1125 start_codon:yes stop_codon:yes gene_type:complete